MSGVCDLRKSSDTDNEGPRFIHSRNSCLLVFCLGGRFLFLSFVYSVVSAQPLTLELASCVAFGTEYIQGHRQLCGLGAEWKSQALMIKTIDHAILDHL